MYRDDAHLVLAARAGDRDAFGELVRRHNGLVYAAALSTVRDWSAAEEIAQESFLSAWSNLSELRVPGSFPHWMRRIARNLALNWVRSQSYRNRLAERYAGESSDMTDPTKTSSDALDRRRELLAALERVGPSVREVLILFYLEERNVQETASALGITEAAVKKRLQRGREALRVALEAQWAQSLRQTSGPDHAESRVSRVMRGLALGPAVPELSSAAAKWTLGHTIAEAARTSAWLKPALAGGAAMTAKQAAIGVAAVVVIAVALLWANRSSESPADPDSAPESDGGMSGSGPALSDAQHADEAGTKSRSAALPFDLPEAQLVDEPSEQDASSLSTSPAGEESSETDPEEPSLVRVAGLVVDEWSDPIEGADVFALENETRKDNELPLSSLALASELSTQKRTQSAADGSFSFDIPSDAWSVNLYAVTENFQGVAYASVEKGVDTNDVRIVVKSGEALLGRILTDNRKPVAGASIVSMAHVASGSSHGGRSRFAVSDEDGYFVLLFDKPGFAALRVVTQIHGEQVFLFVPIGVEEPADLVLQAPAVLRGAVRYNDGRPAIDVRLTAESQILMESGGAAVRVNGSRFGVPTDSTGNYEFVALAPDLMYEVHVLSPDYKIDLAPRVELGPFQTGETAVHDFVLSDTITVRGLLTDRDGNPVTGSRLRISNQSDPAVSALVSVDESGYYEVTLGGEPGRYDFVPSYQHIPPDLIEELAPDLIKVVELDTGDTNEADVTLDAAFTIAIHVADADGRPIQGAAINPEWHPQENTAYGFGALGVTDAQGLHSWNGYGPIGTYSLSIRKEGYLSRESEPYAGAPGAVFDDEQVVLYQPTGIEGRVTLDGIPASNARLVISALHEGQLLAVAHVPLAADGRFQAPEQLPATSVTLEISLDREVHDDPPPVPRQFGPIKLQPNDLRDIGVVDFVSAPPQEHAEP